MTDETDETDDFLPAQFRAVVDSFDELVDQGFDLIRGITLVDKVYYGASEMGDFSGIWHIAGAGRSVAARDPILVVKLSTALGVESLLVNGVIKSFFRRTRPRNETERPHYLRQPKTSSFPSGHASSAFMAAAMLTRHEPRLRAFWYAIAAVVATSRIHVRIHHGSDVIAGAALGVVLGRLANRIVPLPPTAD